MFDCAIIGAIKIKDGLFLGDEFSAKDLEFCIANKVNYIINCCGRQVPNHWTAIGITYLTFNWRDSDDQVIFDGKSQCFAKAIKFIDSVLQKGDSVLIHSVRGQSRSCCVAVAYLIHKYRWTLEKAFEFLRFRRPDACIRPHFLKQLRDFEEIVRKKSCGILTDKWNESTTGEEDELLLRNTFLNAQRQRPEQNTNKVNNEPKVKWADEEKKTPLVSIIPWNKHKQLRSKPPTGVKVTMKGAEIHKTPERKPKGENCSATDFLDELEDLGRSPPKTAIPLKIKPGYKKIIAGEQDPNTKIVTTLGVIKPMSAIYNFNKDPKTYNRPDQRKNKRRSYSANGKKEGKLNPEQHQNSLKKQTPTDIYTAKAKHSNNANNSSSFSKRMVKNQMEMKGEHIPNIGGPTYENIISEDKSKKLNWKGFKWVNRPPERMRPPSPGPKIMTANHKGPYDVAEAIGAKNGKRVESAKTNGRIVVLGGYIL